MSNYFEKRGYGRIFVKEESDISKVKAVMSGIDLYETQNYYPPNLIGTFDEYPKLECVGKFDDMDLEAVATICFKKGIDVLIINNRHLESITKPIK